MVYGGAWYECGTQGNWLEHSVAEFGLCLANYIRLEPEWIPREENQMAGYISRIMDHDNWSLDPVVFKVLSDRWGLHTLNSFAAHYNAQLEHFTCNSRYACPGSEAVDSFTAGWGGG